MATYTTITTDEEKKLQSSAATAAPATANYGLSYDPTTSQVYNDALAALETTRKAMPTYTNSYTDKQQSLYEQLTGREFSYNVSDEALYQQYRQQYTQQGKTAMMDTMGQAAALTGGYGSTYSQSVGQQQYGEYLQRLNEVVPELYSQAYQRWLDEGEAMLDDYNIINAEAQEEYDRYLDAVGAYWQEVDYLQGRVDDAYQQGLTADEMAYGRMQDNYEKLVDLMTTTGYQPTDDELTAAGMTAGQRDAYLTWYAQQNAASSGGSGRRSTKSTKSTKTVAEDAVVSAGAGALAGASGGSDTGGDSTETQRNAWNGTYGETTEASDESWLQKLINGLFRS